MNKSIKAKPKLLFIVPWYFANLPRNIRAQNIIKYLADSYECHVLCFDIPKAYGIGADARIHKIQFTSFSKYVLQRSYFPNLEISKPLLFILRGFSYLLMKYVLYPDNLTLEIGRVTRALHNLDAEHKFEKIVLSIIPFSLFAILDDPRFRARTIADIGDPLLHKSVFCSPRRFEEKYLSLANKLIVTNESTRNYYIEKRKIPETKLFVVRQGYDDAIFLNENSSSDVDFRKLTLILTGQLYGGGLRDPRPLFRAISTFKKTDPLTATYYGTSISNDQAYKDVVEIFAKVCQARLSEAYKRHNILVFIDNENLLQTPGKIFELLAMKIPILYLYTIETETKVMLEGVDGIFFVKNEYSEILNFFRRIINRSISFRFCEWGKSACWERRAKEFRDVLID